MSAVADKPRRTTTLGRYELLVEIGQAGGARLHLAHLGGAAGFEKLVILRELEGAPGALLDEARRAALIKHPGVIDIAEIGEADGRYFVATEDLEGESLRRIVELGRSQARLDELAVARIIANAAESLDAAHDLRTATGAAAGFAHGHLTLDSLVVLYTGQVKIADFGVTPDHALEGAAPETLGGAKPDRRSDYFSLGVVMWQALTHERLFDATTDTELRRAIQTLEIPRASERNANVPAAFDDILARALDRDPAKRHATGTELANEIEDVLGQAGYSRRNDKIAAFMTEAFADRIAARRRLMQHLATSQTPATAAALAAFGPMPVASLAAAPTMLLHAAAPAAHEPAGLEATAAPVVAAPVVAAPVVAAPAVAAPVPAPVPVVAPVEASAPVVEAPAPVVEAPAPAVPAIPPPSEAGPADASGGSHPAAVVSLGPIPGSTAARRDGTGEHDVLSRWAFQSDAHAAIRDVPDYEPPPPRSRAVLYMIVAGIAAAGAVAVIAFGFGGKKSAKRPATAASAAEGVAADGVETPDDPSAVTLAAADPAAVDPVAADPAAVDPVGTDPAGTDPAGVDPTAADPAAVDPAAVDPAGTDPAAAVEIAPAAPPPPAPAAVAVAPEAPRPVEPAVEPPAVEPPAARTKPEPKAKAKAKAKPQKRPKRAPRVAKAGPAGPIDPYAETPKLDKAALAAEAQKQYRTGLQLFARGEHSAALTALKGSLADNPGSAATWRALGLVYEKTGQKQQARAAFKRYLRLAPGAGDATQIRDRLDRLGS